MSLARSFAALIAAAAFVPATVAAADTPLAGTRLDITAEGEVSRVPDLATISAGVVTQAATAGAAMSANARQMTAAIAALKRAGVADRDIRTASINLSPQYRYAENQINGPEFSVDQPEAALDEARTAAIRKAKARADLYAHATGMTVRRIVSISEAGGYNPPPRPMMAMQARAKADTPIEAGEQKLGVSVSVTFELE